MITGIAIENFKGIGDRVEVQLKPITLLFGANSSGKSSILHALHYAREVFDRHNLDADQTIAGGRFVDLGGFRNFLHGHKLDRTIVLEFELNLQQAILPDYTPSLPAGINTEMPESLFRELKSARVAVSIEWSHFLKRPVVTNYSTKLDGVSFGEITFQPGQIGCVLTFNTRHPVLIAAKTYWTLSNTFTVNEDDERTALEFLCSWCSDEGVWRRATAPRPEQAGKTEAEPDIGECGIESAFVANQPDALPVWGRTLSIVADFSGVPVGAALDEVQSPFEWIRDELSRLIVAPGELIADQLRRFVYLGPLRETPSRNYVPPRYPDPSRWASGLGAWDRLHNGEETLVTAVSDWLGDSDRLNSGSRVERRQYKEVDLGDPLMVQLVTGRAFDESEAESRIDLTQVPEQTRLVIVSAQSDVELQPHDVGVGISQLVPVVVSALDDTHELALIEQPELHLHPGVQVGLSDLFIHAIQASPRTLLIETHSEHLLLRLLRRVRETTEGELADGRPGLLAEQLGVVFVESNNGMVRVRPLTVTPDGNFAGYWPEGFFEERSKELF